jgi:hypothetical protein
MRLLLSTIFTFGIAAAWILPLRITQSLSFHKDSYNKDNTPPPPPFYLSAMPDSNDDECYEYGYEEDQELKTPILGTWVLDIKDLFQEKDSKDRNDRSIRNVLEEHPLTVTVVRQDKEQQVELTLTLLGGKIRSSGSLERNDRCGELTKQEYPWVLVLHHVRFISPPWGFFGVRGNGNEEDHEDNKRINPLNVLMSFLPKILQAKKVGFYAYLCFGNRRGKDGEEKVVRVRIQSPVNNKTITNRMTFCKKK